MNTLVEGIEDNPHNRTRFLVIGYSKPEPCGKDKTSIVFSMPNKSGSLYHALNVFDSESVNLTMIDRGPPSRCRGNISSSSTVRATKKTPPYKTPCKNSASMAMFARVLGSYPEAE